jgi:hypothetical protein
MNDDSDDNIASILGITPIKEVRGQIVNYDRPEADNSLSPVEQLNADREYARTNLYSAIENGVKALEDITEVARQTQQPRAYEVIATLIKTLSDVNKDLVSMSANKVKETDSETQPNESKTINNNLVFNGTTSQLADLLKQQSKDN